MRPAPAMEQTAIRLRPPSTDPGARRARARSVLPVAALAGYAVIVLSSVTWHEPWFDEAQAWLLARDASLPDLLFFYPRYEGSPVLWQMLLVLPAKLSLPYDVLNGLGAAAAIVGAGLVLLRSPFPLPVRLLVVSSYWLAFQYAVVARSYCLIPPLLFGIALVWHRRTERLALFFGLLLLLANVSFHAFIVAAALLAVHLLDVALRWHTIGPRARLANGGAAAGFALVAVLLFLQLRTPADHSFPGAHHVETDPGVVLESMLTMAAGGLTGSRMTTIVVLLVTTVFLLRRRALLVWALPSLAVAGFSGIRYGNVWHQGILLLLWLFALWVALDEGETRPARWRPSFAWEPLAVAVVMAGVLLVQVRWAALAVRHDLVSDYSAAPEVAEYIKRNGLDNDRIRIHTRSLEATSVQPYFDRNIWSNYDPGRPAAFWWWSQRTKFPVDPEGLVEGRPELIVYGDKWGGTPQRIPPPSFPGYRLDAHVAGALFLKDRIYEYDGYYLYRPERER